MRNCIAEGEVLSEPGGVVGQVTFVSWSGNLLPVFWEDVAGIAGFIRRIMMLIFANGFKFDFSHY
jgi:hypothetical protein